MLCSSFSCAADEFLPSLQAEAMRRSADVSGAANGVDLSQQSNVGGM